MLINWRKDVIRNIAYDKSFVFSILSLSLLGVINMCFMLLFRDLIRLFACYNDGIINLLEKYFDMNKKQCRDALDLYKKFLVRMDRVGEFLKVAEVTVVVFYCTYFYFHCLLLFLFNWFLIFCEIAYFSIFQNVGIDKGDIPDLTKAPSSLLEALEQHLATLEGKKGSAANTPTQSARYVACCLFIDFNSVKIFEGQMEEIYDFTDAQCTTVLLVGRINAIVRFEF